MGVKGFTNENLSDWTTHVTPKHKQNVNKQNTPFYTMSVESKVDNRKEIRNEKC